MLLLDGELPPALSINAYLQEQVVTGHSRGLLGAKSSFAQLSLELAALATEG